MVRILLALILVCLVVHSSRVTAPITPRSRSTLALVQACSVFVRPCQTSVASHATAPSSAASAARRASDRDGGPATSAAPTPIRRA